MNIANSRGTFAVLLSVYLALTGCSVGMALSGKQDPDLGAIRVGASRGEVELQLGSPVRTATNADGGRADVYEYEMGNEPSAGRAAFHGAMDVLTLGIWEAVGTPMEAFQGEKRQLMVTYGADDRVVSLESVTATAAAPDQEKKKASVGIP